MCVLGRSEPAAYRADSVKHFLASKNTTVLEHELHSAIYFHPLKSSWRWKGSFNSGRSKNGEDPVKPHGKRYSEIFWDAELISKCKYQDSKWSYSISLVTYFPTCVRATWQCSNSKLDKPDIYREKNIFFYSFYRTQHKLNVLLSGNWM